MNSIKSCCESIIRTGFGILRHDFPVLQHYDDVLDRYSAIAPAVKKTFSFREDTDGFFPFGAEYSQHEDQPDLCERFCYWPAHAARRKGHELVKTDFYRSVERYEASVSELARQLMDQICTQFCAAPLRGLREASYLQLCVYGEQRPDQDRKFVQDPHEDGHLLSLIKPNEEGLVLVHGSHLEPVRLLRTEIAVLAGSLLTQLSGSSIPAAYHAVLTPDRPMRRSSLVYFLNPASDHILSGFQRGEPIRLDQATNARHISFGNRPLQLS